ncbi:MAG: hypothetical protein SF051_16680, partial [Elusimicrobiota bacterium]|nr:hypothetical protein [Elusimicrobiota bacterium]
MTARALDRLALAALAAVALAGFVVVARHAPSLPLADDWGVVNARALPAGLTLDWLFARHIGHLTVFTKLQAHLVHAFGGWDPLPHHLSNHALWIAAVAAAGLLLRSATGAPAAALAPFLLLAFTLKTTYISLAWVSTCHFALLFSFAAVRLLFDERQRDRDLAWGTVAGVCALYAYGAGLTFMAAVVPVFAAFKAARAASLAPARRRAELGRLGAVLLALAAAAAAWTLPVSTQSWVRGDPASIVALFAGLTAGGFGWGGFPPTAVGLALAAAAAAPP